MEDRQAGTHGQEDGVEPVAQLAQGVRAADDRVRLDLDAVATRRSTSCWTMSFGSRNSGIP